jgi:hypothetical protein
MNRWFVDFRKVTDAGWLKRIRSLRGLQNPGAGADQGPMHLTWQRWGLAIPPSDTADLDELETWIL